MENWTIEIDGEDWTFLTQEEYDKEVAQLLLVYYIIPQPMMAVVQADKAK